MALKDVAYGELEPRLVAVAARAVVETGVVVVGFVARVAVAVSECGGVDVKNVVVAEGVDVDVVVGVVGGLAWAQNDR